MIVLQIGSSELRNTVENLLSLCSVNISDGGDLLVCDDTFAADASRDHSRIGVIVICKKSAYLSSRAHLNLSEIYGEKYAVFKTPFIYAEFIDTVRCFSVVKQATQCQYSDSKLTFSAELGTVTYGARTVTLSPKEMKLFVSLYQRRGSAVSREALKNEVWNGSTEEGTNIVDVYISYLRKKLNPLLGAGSIVSSRGMGYMLILPQAPQE